MLIHLGFPKAASTWLQHYVFNNKELGFTIPWNDARILAVDQFSIVNPFDFNTNDVRRTFSDARIQLNRTNELVEVLSDETLGGNPLCWWVNAKVIADRMFKVFPDAKIFICIREQKKMILSLYSQYIKHGNTKKLEQFIGAQGVAPGGGPICDLSQLEYHKVIRYYQSLYGKENVLVLTLEQLQKNKSNFLKQLTCFAGCGARNYNTENIVTNRSYGAATVLIRRVLNHISSPPNYIYPKEPISFRIVNKASSSIDKLIPISVQTSTEDRNKIIINDFVKNKFQQSNKITATITGIDLKSFGYD